MMFTEQESRDLQAMKRRYDEEAHEAATNTMKHLEFMRWLIAHGKMEADKPTDRPFATWKQG